MLYPSFLPRFVVVVSTCLALSLPQISEAAKVKGKLNLSAGQGSPAQFRVMSVSKRGNATLATVSAKGNFTITTEKNSSLHLVDSANRYFGPIIASGGVKAYAVTSGKSGSLGTVTVKRSFAAAPYGKSKNIFTKSSVAFNKRTGPRGAGKLGLVRSAAGRRSVNANAETPSNIGEDLDKDGIPSAVDVDDDGDLVLDVSDADSQAAADFDVSISSTLRVELKDSINANAAGITNDQIDSALVNGLILGFRARSNKSGVSLSAVNVDCGTLPYCTPGSGTATIRSDNLENENREGTPWVDYDPDGDGYPNLVVSEPPAYVGVRARASREQLRPGDTIYFNLSTSSGAVTVPAVLPFYFLTGPAIKEYTSGSVTGSISYPVAGNAPGTSKMNPLPLGGTTVTFTFWKPQRPAITGAESGDFVDMGKLTYGIFLAGFEGSNGVYTCAASDYSVPSGSTLSPAVGDSSFPLRDGGEDALANPGNTLSYTIDFGSCFARHGLPTQGTKFMINFCANSEKRDQTSQDLFLQLP